MKTNKDNQINPKEMKPDAKSETTTKPAVAKTKSAKAPSAPKATSSEDIAGKSKEVAIAGENETTNSAIEMSDSFKKILPNIHAGELVTLSGEEGFYFQYEHGRLKKYADAGAYIGTAPLYSYQDKSGWALKK